MHEGERGGLAEPFEEIRARVGLGDEETALLGDLAARLGPRFPGITAAHPVSRWFPGGPFASFEMASRLIDETFPNDPEKGRRLRAAVWKSVLFESVMACRAALGRGDERAPHSDLSEEMYHDLIQNYPEMVLAMRDGGEIVEANRAALESLGYDAEEIRQLTIHHLVADSHHPRIRMHIERVVRSGRDRVEAHLLTRSGEEKHVELVSTAVRGEDGVFVGARVFIRDLTDRKRLEQEMLRLERLVAVGSMAAKVAHEIRNPLSSISLNVELLLDEIRRSSKGALPEAESLVGSILSEIDRLTNVIEDYLSFGRLPSPSLEPVDPRAFLQSIADFVRPDLNEHRIELSIEVFPGTPPLLADRNQVRQSILNLFRNSQEAMPQGGTIHVVVGARDGDVVIEVRDTGLGIPKDEIRKIFDPFYTTKEYGTGLGLAFVQQVMREHGGRVTCRSHVRGGTVFTLHFPAARE